MQGAAPPVGPAAQTPNCLAPAVALVRATLIACRRALALIILTVSFAQTGVAQDGSLNAMLGTLDVEAKPNFARGQLDGCLVEFNVLTRDWT